jgi:UDP-N-acetylglucosamine:LPS N-acetylglucosamine transferase
MKSIIFTTSEGHLSIAQSLEAFLTEHKFETKLIFRKEAGLRYYQLVYQRAPALFKPVYELSKTAIADFVSKIYLSKEHNDFIENTFAEENPEYVFNTSFGFNNSIVKMQTQRSFTFINVIPNPRTFFLQDVAKADVTCVFDDFIQQEVQQLIPDRKVIKTGWFVRPAFEKEYDKPAVRAELGFDQKKLLFLLVSGSEGTEAILALAKKLRGLNNVELAIACGNNQGLLEKINSLAEKSEPSIKAIPFTTEIHKYMQAADLVIGKAGPNMVFEAIATGTPLQRHTLVV